MRLNADEEILQSSLFAVKRICVLNDRMNPSEDSIMPIDGTPLVDRVLRLTAIILKVPSRGS